MNRIFILFSALFLCVQASANEYNAPQLNMSVSKTNDEYIGTLTGHLQATEHISVSAELDTTGYLELGTGYGFSLGKSYNEVYVSYGRGDLIDVYTLGVFSGFAVTENVLLFGNTSHEWRELVFDAIDGTREWKNTVGASYAMHELVKLSYSFSYDKSLSQSGHRTYQEVRVTFTPKWVEPYVQYTFGDHRVTPADIKISQDATLELGLQFRF
ncbi:hypothetical protein BCU83_15860 [Vibrio breoganii]|uniref:hypothetical protein n=1 Tax=Vibrio breoganii TaxID=553239 RepID=UPI000C84366B|nr:hypothetical protein [Vibrio breoganii]PMG77085.1 hypothetical protein BCU83_15860 [Vibrio breoganii]